MFRSMTFVAGLALAASLGIVAAELAEPPRAAGERAPELPVVFSMKHTGGGIVGSLAQFTVWSDGRYEWSDKEGNRKGWLAAGELGQLIRAVANGGEEPDGPLKGVVDFQWTDAYGAKKTRVYSWPEKESCASLLRRVKDLTGEVGFETVVDSGPWIIPEKPEGSSRVNVALRITNRSDKALLFHRFDTIEPTLKSASGKAYELSVGRKRTRLTALADYRLLAPGESATFVVDTNLSRENGKMTIGGSDGFGGVWRFSGLEPGQYELALHYAVREQKEDVTIRGDAGSLTVSKDKVWIGETTTAPVKIALLTEGAAPKRSLSLRNATDADLAALKDKQDVRQLNLSNSKVTDAGLVNLTEMKGLQQLDLTGAQVTGAGLASLKELKDLRSLSLDANVIYSGGAALANLKEMKGLQTLNLSHALVMTAGTDPVDDLKAALPNVQIQILSAR